MKKVTSICFVVFLILMLFMSTAMAAPEYTGEVNVNTAILLDADSGQILYETDNIDDQIAPASTTKIMTCILALEKSSLDDVVTVGSEGDWSNSKYSLLGTKNGEEIVMKDLLYGMMLVSGNDAACAVAVHVAGSVEAFVQMMNDKAEELGMTNTHFANPHGTDDEEHYVTARDMATLTLYAVQNEDFMDIVGTESYDMPATNANSARTVDNTNHLLNPDEEEYYYRYATGIKTGSTPNAGKCLVASATKDDMNLICLIYGDETEYGSERWSTAEELFNWGFDEFKTVKLSVLLDNTEQAQLQVNNYAASDENDGILVFDTPDVYVTAAESVIQDIIDGTDSVQISYSTDSIEAPVTEGEVLGTVTYSSAATGDEIYSGDLIASREILASGTEADASGGTAVATLPPTVPEEIVTKEDNASVWYWLLIPGGLIVFLVVRLLTVNKRKRKRFKSRRPHYSYKIKR